MAANRDRIKIFIIDALITLLAFFLIQAAAGAVYRVYEKVRWAYQVIDQLGPNFQNLIPPVPNSKNDKKTDLASWIRQNLPRAGKEDYREVGDIFLAAAEKLRSGELDGKREAYADTARELARTVDRSTWTPFIAALVNREEAEAAEENAELADLFELVGRTIRAEAPAAAAEPAKEEGGRIA